MKLISVQVFANGKFGWESDKLVFGDSITQLYGPNGCGKTPIVQSIAYCLGYPCIFRNDIYDKCSHAILEIETSKGLFIIKRKYIRGRDVEIEVKGPNSITELFHNEKEYSLFIFGVLEIKVSRLVGNDNKVTTPYLATLLPILYLDQDEGYNKYYSPPSNFIKDQFSEMMRLIFKLPVKNAFDLKKSRIEAKERLGYLDGVVNKQSRELNIATENMLPVNKTEDELLSEISDFEEQLNNLKLTGSSHDDSIAAFDKLISGNKRNIGEIRNELLEINKREKSVNSIITDINTEIETLNINEEAKRVFLSFNEICGSSNCQLFSVSSESYSKNLLYLKDQIKDLKRNSSIDVIRKEQHNEQIKIYEEQIKALIDGRNSTVENSEISALVEAASEIKNRIFELQSQYSELISIERMKVRNFETLVLRNSALDEFQSYSTGGVAIPEIGKLRSELKEYFVKWLDTLNTKNIRRDISFRDEFAPVLGNEKIRQLKGSTRTRAVLAFHAALVELIVRNGLDEFKFLILDTPKQHEVHNDDLDGFILSLKEIADEMNIQVVFSTTEYHYECGSGDMEWVPKYPGEEQNMFLKSEIKIKGV